MYGILPCTGIDLHILLQARESAASRLESPQDETDSQISGLRVKTAVAVSSPAPAVPPEVPPPASPLTPGPKKRVTIADYKKRREASRTDSTEREEEEEGEGRRTPSSSSYLSLGSGGLLPPLTSLPELPGLESRRSNHHPSPQKNKESSPKRGPPAVRKYEKWESKPKPTTPSKGE